MPGFFTASSGVRARVRNRSSVRCCTHPSLEPQERARDNRKYRDAVHFGAGASLLAQTCVPCAAHGQTSRYTTRSQQHAPRESHATSSATGTYEQQDHLLALPWSDCRTPTAAVLRPCSGTPGPNLVALPPARQTEVTAGLGGRGRRSRRLSHERGRRPDARTARTSLCPGAGDPSFLR